MTALAAQVESLSKNIDGMMTPRVALIMAFETCSGGNPTSDYPIVSASSGHVEQVNYISGMN